MATIDCDRRGGKGVAQVSDFIINQLSLLARVSKYTTSFWLGTHLFLFAT